MTLTNEQERQEPSEAPDQPVAEQPPPAPPAPAEVPAASAEEPSTSGDVAPAAEPSAPAETPGAPGEAPAAATPAPAGEGAPAPRGEGPPGPRGDGDRDRQRRPRGRFGRRKVCFFCVDKVEHIDYKDPSKLRRYVSDRGRIEPRRKTGTCAKHQRRLSMALKRARHLALLPYTAEHIRSTGVFAPRS